MFGWKNFTVALVVFGCGDVDDKTERQEQVGCEAMILEMSPGDGASGVSAEQNPQITFSQSVSELSWGLEMSGIPGEAALSTDGTTATFKPTEALAANTTYTLTGSVCDRSRTTQFSTVGTTIDPEPLAGRIYAVPFGTGQWIEPAAWEEIMNQLGLNLPEHLLLKVTEVQDGTPILHGAFTERGGNGQSPCDPTLPFGETQLTDNPLFTTPETAAQIALEWYGFLDFQSLQIQGEFERSGEALINLSLDGLIDSRGLILVGEDGPYTACSTPYVDCVPCADGLEQCIPVHIETDAATWWPEASLDEGFKPKAVGDCWPES